MQNAKYKMQNCGCALSSRAEIGAPFGRAENELILKQPFCILHSAFCILSEAKS